MPEVDVIDSTWIGVEPARIAPILGDPSRWADWWPDLDVAATELRGAKGVRWLVRSAHHGRLAGTMEVWLEPVADGTVAHYFLRLNGSGRLLSRREHHRLVRHYRIQTKQGMWRLADTVDPDRLARVRTPHG